jgi:hypothetical protein
MINRTKGPTYERDPDSREEIEDVNGRERLETVPGNQGQEYTAKAESKFRRSCGPGSRLRERDQ